MATVRRNIFANIAGRVWSALIGFALVPYYIRFLGVESYALLGVFASMQAMLLMLDLGLSETLAREAARLSVDPRNSTRLADTARTLEVVYWLVAVAVAGAIAALSRVIAYHWLNPEKMSRESVASALIVTALVIGLRWPISLYTGGLNGLQRQVAVNWISSLSSTVQGIGALVVLAFISRTVRAFFFWQALVAALQVITLRFVFWRHMASAPTRMFRKDILRDVWRFAAGMSGLAVVGTVLMQMDKVLLSRLLPLRSFGYYTFAVTIASMVYNIVSPVFIAYYPHLTEIATVNDLERLKKTYHQGSQVMALLVLPACLTLVFFSKDLLGLWLRDQTLISNSYLLISLLVVGNSLHGLMHLPYALQLAYGRTALSFWSNVLSITFLLPGLYFSATRWGAVGAASTWITLNVFYTLAVVQIMHRTLLPTEKQRWYLSDIGRPLMAAIVVFGIGRFLIGETLLPIVKALSIALVAGLATVAAAASLDDFDALSWLRQRIQIRD